MGIVLDDPSISIMVPGGAAAARTRIGGLRWDADGRSETRLPAVSSFPSPAVLADAFSQRFIHARLPTRSAPAEELEIYGSRRTDSLGEEGLGNSPWP